MLDNLRKIIDSENSAEFMNEAILEAAGGNDVADMFINTEDEAEIDDVEVEKILKNIPEYDEEEVMEKKLRKITESFIPEEL